MKQKKGQGILEKFRSKSHYGMVFTVLFIAVLIVFNTALYGLSNYYSWYFYTDEVYEHQISSATDTYLEDAAKEGGSVRIIFCDNEDNLREELVYRLCLETCLQYAERHDFISVEYVNIYTNPELVYPYKYQMDDDGNYVVDSSTGKYVKLNTINTSSVIFAGEDNYVVLSMGGFFILDSDDELTAYNGEEIAAAMIYRVLQKENPKAYFTMSHGESYSTAFYNRLLCSGYVLDVIDLMTDDLVNTGNDILIISNPQYDFVRGNPEKGIRAELDKIESFLGEGGSVYVMLDPLVTNTVYLEEMLTSWGITIMRADTEAQERDSVLVHDATDSVTTDGYALITNYTEDALSSQIEADMTSINSGRVIVKQASPLVLTQVEGKTVTSLLTSSETSKAYANGSCVDSNGTYTVVASSQDDTTKGAILVADSVYMTDQNALTTNEYGNKDFVFYLFHYLSGADVPTGCTFIIFEITSLENLTIGEARMWTILIAVILPLLVVAFGVVYLRRRRNR